METTVDIDGKEVRLKSTAMVPVLYRMKFGRDMMRDVMTAATAGDDELGAMSVETIGRIAYIMAKHADPDAVPDSLEEWLESVPTMAIYSMIPIVMALWTGNLACLEEAKKKWPNRPGIHNGAPHAPSCPARSPTPRPKVHYGRDAQ